MHCEMWGNASNLLHFLLLPLPPSFTLMYTKFATMLSSSMSRDCGSTPTAADTALLPLTTDRRDSDDLDLRPQLTSKPNAEPYPSPSLQSVTAAESKPAAGMDCFRPAERLSERVSKQGVRWRFLRRRRPRPPRVNEGKELSLRRRHRRQPPRLRWNRRRKVKAPQWLVG